MKPIDEASEIRQGESLELDRIESFLRDTISDLGRDFTVQQFPSGHSNLTYLIHAGQRDLVLRRPPFGTKAATAHDMVREYRVLSALQDVYPYSPRPLALCEDDDLIGCPFYVMEPIRGIVIRREIPPSLKLSASDIGQLFQNTVKAQFDLHAIDYGAIGLENFGKPAGYIERQVSGWSKRYRAARTPDAPDSKDIMQWLAANMPPDSPAPGIIHNDFKLDNIVLDPQNPLKVIGVLDWEMATLGDPRMDLGCSLGYWVQADDPPEMQAIRFLPTHVPGALSREQMVKDYSRLTGNPIDKFDFFLVFGVFRLAVIVQQIYYRYYHGQTSDQRFKAFITAVNVLDKTAQRFVERADC